METAKFPRLVKYVVGSKKKKKREISRNSVMNLTNRILLNSDAATIHREMWNFNSRQGSNMKCTPLQGMRIPLYLGHFQSLDQSQSLPQRS